MKKIWTSTQAVYFSLKLLIKPDDTRTVLNLGNLLTQLKAFDVTLEKAKADPTAKELIEKRFGSPFPDISKLKTYPEGSLGKTYYAHLTENKLTPYPIVTERNFNEKEYVRERQREIHDLLHAFLDLGIDLTSEAALNAFVMAQVYSPISTLIVLGSSVHVMLKQPQDLANHFELIFKYFKMGRDSASIFSIQWEDFLKAPVKDLRKNWVSQAS